MFFRIITVLIVMAGLYTLYGIGHFHLMHHRIYNPVVDFQVKDEAKAGTTVVEFLNYGCGYCKSLHPTIEELLRIRNDIRYIVKPVVFGDGAMVRLNQIVIASGLQGKFWEMHEAILNHPEQIPPDSFLEETANLFGLDYEQLLEDAQGEEVKKIADKNLKATEHANIYAVPAFVIKRDIHIVTDENLPDLKDLLDIIAEAENS
ncbi:MAG: DsbA family protein [Pseudomonadota bacterium]